MRQQSKFSLSVGIYPPAKGGDKGRVYLKLRHSDENRRFRTEIFADKSELSSTYKDEIAARIRLLYCIVDRLDHGSEGFSFERAWELYNQYYEEPYKYDEKIGFLQEKIDNPSNYVFIDLKFRNYFNEVRATVSDGETSSLLKFISNKESENFNDSRINTTNAFRSTRNSLTKYLGGKDIQIKDVNEEFILGYEDYLKQSGIADSTISFYLRSLRRIINLAVKEGLINTNETLFSKANTKVLFSNTREAGVVLSKKQLHQLIDMQLKDNPRLELARDVFMFSFYLRGAELSAIAQLTNENIEGSYIIYNKRTDGNEVKTLLEPSAKDLILKYKGINDSYLFPILTYPTPAGYQTIRNRFSEWLSTLGKMLLPAVNLTFSSAKSTWERFLEETPLSTYFLEYD